MKGREKVNKDEIMSRFESKYEIDQEDLCSLYLQAKNAYLEAAFPFEHSITEIPENRPRAWQIVYECMEYIYERTGYSACTGYSENGVSIKWDTGGVSSFLTKKIMPKARTF